MKYIRYICRVCLPDHLDHLGCRACLPDDLEPPHGCLYPRVWRSGGRRLQSIPAAGLFDDPKPEWVEEDE
jgi:hypothetical protein